MKIIEKIILITSLITPFNAEYILRGCNRIGNMALYGIFLDIYNKRNIYYFSITLLFIEYINNHTMYCILLVLLSFAAFINSCIKWSDIIFYNIKN
uniref:Uncharacterized protein n=1 Tax=viral metagenome TaxID=1070528 RepID=A0A6C0ARJ1_9ZZZZ